MSNEFKEALNILKRNKVNQKDIASALNVNESYISRISNGKDPLTDSVIKVFNKHFGKIIKLNSQKNDIVDIGDETLTKQSFQDELRETKLSRKRGEVPLISEDEAFAAAESELIAPTDPVYYDPNRQTINIGDFLSDSTAAMPVYGNSMMPNYPSGCIVGLKLSNNNFFEPGEVYVFEHNGKRILKRLFYKDDDPDSDFIMCYSDNTMKFEGGARSGKLAYPPFYVNKNDITRMFPVTGVIKRNINASIINKM